MKPILGYASRSDSGTTWLLRVGVALLFIYVGQTKFAARSSWIEIFNRIGFGQWLRYLTGVLQVFGGVLILIPRTFVYGIIVLACTMAGAMAAWVFFLGSPVTAVIPGFLLLGLFFVGSEELIYLLSKLKQHRLAC
jgi:putative oxidoreductase